MAKKNNKLVYLVALFLFVGGVGYMVYSGISSQKVYFMDVSEALAMPAEEIQAARLFGTVASGDLVRPDNQLGVRFALQDQFTPDLTIVVDYRGVVPDTFEPGAEVIVEGSMQGHAFHATTLMTKCPSKYEKENRV